MLETNFDNIIDNHRKIFRTIPEDDMAAFIELLGKFSKSGRIFGLGAGRMGYSLQSFIMRLSHLGFNAYMIGDTSLPRVSKSDLVIVNSSSGNTPSIALYAEQAKAAGAYIFLLTSASQSHLLNIADKILKYSVEENRQLMKTVHEQFSYLILDYIVHRLVVDNKMDVNAIEQNHSILE